MSGIPNLDIDTRLVRQPRPVEPSRFRFPDPRQAPRDGFVAHGGDLAPGTVLEAYANGIFPWPHEDIDELWFSPDPRAVIPMGGLHISRRLARTLHQGRFTLSIDRSFEQVVAACAERPEGTWITPGYQQAYSALHAAGWAHSFEIWGEGGRLAGGLYGIAVGGLFGAESMFHRVSDASKVAMAAMCRYLAQRGFVVIDVQLLTPHLARMGAIEVPREEYLRLVERAVAMPQRFAAGR